MLLSIHIGLLSPHLATAEHAEAILPQSRLPYQPSAKCDSNSLTAFACIVLGPLGAMLKLAIGALWRGSFQEAARFKPAGRRQCYQGAAFVPTLS